eukprot:366086-Chlamydomonas_euryale.AAC.17
MARCHRIGQMKEVTVYRLISKDTYEEQLFSTASRKYGACSPTALPTTSPPLASLGTAVLVHIGLRVFRIWV